MIADRVKQIIERPGRKAERVEYWQEAAGSGDLHEGPGEAGSRTTRITTGTSSESISLKIWPVRQRCSKGRCFSSTKRQQRIACTC